MTEQAKNPKDNAAEIISVAAKAALKKAAGDSRNAAILMEQGARKNPALFRALTEPYLTDACWEAVRTAAHSTRKRIWSAPTPEAPRNPNAVGTKFGGGSSAASTEQRDRVVALARGNAATLLDFPLPIAGLPKLGQATVAMLREGFDFYRKQSNDMSAKAKFLSLIIDKMPDEKAIVGTVMDDAALRKLQAKAGASDAE